MQIQIYGNSSTSLQDRIEKKLSKLSKYHEKITSIKVSLSVVKNEHKASAIVFAGTEFYAEAVSDDMYKTVDLLADKVTKQLLKSK